MPYGLHSSLFTLRGWKYVCFTHGLVFGYERGRLTVHLWAANEGVTHKKRGWQGAEGVGGVGEKVPWLCKPLQFSHECLSLGPPPSPLWIEIPTLGESRPPPRPPLPPTPLSPQRSAHTEGHSKRINTKSMGIRWRKKGQKEERKTERERKRKNLLSNII